MRASDYDNEPCGVRLVRLINTQARDSAKREFKNDDKMCLYGTGEYWHGFEHSAYFLSRIFPKSESFVVNHPNYPFVIVGVSVSDKELRKYMKDHSVYHKKEDYIEYVVTPFVPREYGDWLTKKVKSFIEDIDRYSS